MIRKSLFGLLLPLSVAFCDCFDLDIGIGAGYRQDQNRYQISRLPINAPPLFEESWNRMRAFTIEGFTEAHLYWIQARIDADYAWYEGGNVHSTFNVVEDIGILPVKFRSDGGGHAWDGFGSIGIRIPVYCHNRRELVLVPLGGYGYSRQIFRKKNISPSYEIATFSSSSPLFLSLSPATAFKQAFWGPFLGMNIEIANCDLEADLGYSYHWIQSCQQESIQSDANFSFDGPSGLVLGTTQITNSVNFSSSGHHGHRGWFTLSYHFSPCWSVGLAAKYFRVDVKKNRATASNSETTLLQNSLVPQTTTIEQQSVQTTGDWQTFSVTIGTGYHF